MNIEVYILSNPLSSFFMFLNANRHEHKNNRHIYLVLNSYDKNYAHLCLKPWNTFIGKINLKIIYAKDYNFFFKDRRIMKINSNKNSFNIHVSNSINLRFIKKKI